MGIYIIKLRNLQKDESLVLYIGQSVWIMVRCAGHIYKIFKTPEYMGLEQNDLDNDNLELVVEVLESIDEKKKLRDKEREHIRKLKPLTQHSESDRQVKNKKEIVQNAISKWKLK